jgi:hypothetical protein
MTNDSILFFLVPALVAVSMSLPKVDTITILHFNDTHSVLSPIGPRDASPNGLLGGIACAATVVQRVRVSQSNVLLLDAGDCSIGDIFYAYETKFDASRLSSGELFLYAPGGQFLDNQNDDLAEVIEKLYRGDASAPGIPLIIVRAHQGYPICKERSEST